MYQQLLPAISIGNLLGKKIRILILGLKGLMHQSINFIEMLKIRIHAMHEKPPVVIMLCEAGREKK